MCSTGWGQVPAAGFSRCRSGERCSIFPAERGSKTGQREVLRESLGQLGKRETETRVTRVHREEDCGAMRWIGSTNSPGRWETGAGRNRRDWTHKGAVPWSPRRCSPRHQDAPTPTRGYQPPPAAPASQSISFHPFSAPAVNTTKGPAPLIFLSS